MIYIKVITLLLILIFFPISTLALNNSYYYDKGFVVSESTFPVDVANKNTKQADFRLLKKGISTTRNYFGIVEVGDASITEAIKNGNIKSVYYIDNSVEKVNIPFLFFLPIYIKEKRTIVYGE